MSNTTTTTKKEISIIRIVKDPYFFQEFNASTQQICRCLLEHIDNSPIDTHK